MINPNPSFSDIFHMIIEIWMIVQLLTATNECKYFIAIMFIFFKISRCKQSIFHFYWLLYPPTDPGFRTLPFVKDRKVACLFTILLRVLKNLEKPASALSPQLLVGLFQLAISVGLFQLSSQNNSFLATPNVENQCWTSYETLKSFGEMKLVMKFCLCFQNHWTLKFIFSRSRGNFFRCYFRQLFMYLALRKCKHDCKIFKIMLVDRFLSTKTWNCSISYRISS